MSEATGPLFLTPRAVRGGRWPPGFPPRTGNRVQPLVLAAEMYPALERLVLGARNRVFMGFRIFDPETRTRSPEAHALGLARWTDIIRHQVEAGVTLRLLLTDFEPCFAPHLHGGSWASFQALKEMAAGLDEAALDRFEMIVAQHPGEVGWGMRQLLRLPAGLAIRRGLALLAGEEDPGPLLESRPGLWRYHRLIDGQPRYRRGPAPRLWPSTHHHKFAVADDRIAIVGGLDVDERRWETRRYRQPAPDSWHDISLLVEGPAAGDAAEHFRCLWNHELPRYREITRHWMTGVERALTVEPLDDMPEPVQHPAPLPDGSADVQMLRTLSRRSRRLFAVGPAREVRELMHAHARLILSARRLLYIEAQFFRSRRVAGWILEAARRSPALHIIILLPQAPEEVAFDGAGDNPAHQHGEWLQARALGALLRRLGDRVGLYALGRQAPMTEEERGLQADRGAAFGAGMIYVHSKMLIADDRAALVSSANINGRSFGWDSEFGCLWVEPSAVGAFRRRLWGQLMQRDSTDVPDLAAAPAVWRAQAERNVTLAPTERQGFILPYRYARVRRFGRPSWFIPDELV